MNRILITLLGILLFQTVSYAVNPNEYVEKYKDLVENYVTTGDVEMRDDIDRLLRGGVNKCYIANKISCDMAKERNISVEQIHSDTYHNQLYNWHKKGMIDSFSIENINYMVGWIEPSLNIGEDQGRVYFVTADINTTGSLPYHCSDLFYVQDDHIVSIVDMGKDGLGNAIRLYNWGHYDDAFEIFRSLAYNDRNNFSAKYYTAVMLITGKGCKHIDKKVRDHDAAWLGLTGYSFGYGDLTSLALKFRMSLPFTWSTLRRYPPAYKDRRVIKKGKNKYGIIDDSGRMIIDYRKGYSGPLSCSGYAIVSADGTKFGLMDSDGNIILPYDYDDILPFRYDGKFFAIKDGNLLLVSDTGVVLKRIDGSFSTLNMVTDNALILVTNGGKGEMYNYEGQVAYSSDDFDDWRYDERSGNLSLKKDKEVVAYFTEIW